MKGTKMKLVTVEACVAKDNMKQALDLIAGQATSVRTMPGCAQYSIYGTPSGDSLAIVQRWNSQSDFDAYRGSEAFAQLGAQLGPLMTAPPVTVVGEVDTV